MQQWGGTMNYRPEKKRPEKKRRERDVRESSVAQRGEIERQTVATEFRVGKTIAGSTNENRRRNLEHIANRKKKQIRNAIITMVLLGAVVAIVILLANYLGDIAREREALLAQDNPVVPTVTIVDENVGNNLSERYNAESIFPAYVEMLNRYTMVTQSDDVKQSYTAAAKKLRLRMRVRAIKIATDFFISVSSQ